MFSCELASPPPRCACGGSAAVRRQPPGRRCAVAEVGRKRPGPAQAVSWGRIRQPVGWAMGSMGRAGAGGQHGAAVTGSDGQHGRWAAWGGRGGGDGQWAAGGDGHNQPNRRPARAGAGTAQSTERVRTLASLSDAGSDVGSRHPLAGHSSPTVMVQCKSWHECEPSLADVEARSCRDRLSSAPRGQGPASLLLPRTPPRVVGTSPVTWRSLSEPTRCREDATLRKPRVVENAHTIWTRCQTSPG